MNTQYLEFLKTLDIPEGYNYVACDATRNIYAYCYIPNYIHDFYYSNGRNKDCHIEVLPEHIQIDNFADTLVEVKDIKQPIPKYKLNQFVFSISKDNHRCKVGRIEEIRISKSGIYYQLGCQYLVEEKDVTPDERIFLEYITSTTCGEFIEAR